MGVPVSPRNIFPSNIQGLPTWYEVRVSERGYLARRGGVDLMVAMNPQTWEKDIAELEPGGYLLYDSSKPMPPARFRDDIHVLGVPAHRPLRDALHRSARTPAAQEHRLRRRARGDARRRARGDRDAARRAVQGQDQAAPAQPRRLHDGPASRQRVLRRRARPPDRAPRRGRQAHLHRRQRGGGARLRLRRGDGLRLVSDHAELVARRGVPEVLRKLRVDKATGTNKFAIVQAEDEIASIGIVVGAGWNGARAFTATSGPASR
jgi:2-oxoglutarate ferredoxin oxidoreductase subunit alpha